MLGAVLAQLIKRENQLIAYVSWKLLALET